MMTSVLVASISSGLIALILAVLLIFSSKIFKVEVDERVTTLTEMLPGANCGGCGFPGCAQFAKALVDDKAPVDGCSVGGANTASKVADFLGKSSS
ncbi:RnfABCDGE type electron transport complex subunit B [Brachyspira hyodysenteriae]|nr:RnfABCDGE type electron transport complex subunit B [Brachyspira hyodysenteriae]MDA0000802.1 RnfABCDGE type electron transport complex subunit B [Brachyspira hyodysenteriae]